MTLNKKKILLVEDEENLAAVIREALEIRGFEVSWQLRYHTALATYFSYQPDAVILDVMLPDGDGFELAKEIRKDSLQLPVIFLTARSQSHDVIRGFESGGNDYLRKPFSLEELVIRLQALLSAHRTLLQPVASTATSIRLGTLLFEPNKAQLVSDSAPPVQLTARESLVLEVLARHINEPVDRKFLLLKVWENDDFFAGRSLDVFITKLRKYLRSDPDLMIMNIRGKGYKLVAPAV